MSVPKKRRKAPANTLNDLTGKEWIKLTKSWFTLQVKARTASEIAHPGKYPSELVERFLRFFTKKNQWVIDPFLGTGSTLLACRKLSRNGLGIELNPYFIEIAQKNLSQQTLFSESKQEIIQGNSLDIKSIINTYETEVQLQFHLCMTSPPYWNMLSKQRGGSRSQHQDRKEKGLPLVYSENLSDDLGNLDDYEVYLKKLIDVFRCIKPFMAPKSYLVIVLQNIRDINGNFVPIAWDFTYRMKSYFIPRQEQIWCQTDKSLGIWGYPTTYVANVHHHYCLIFQNEE